MTATLLILALLSWSTPVGVGIFFLGVAVSFFLGGVGIELTVAQTLTLAALLFSVPLAAYLAGIFFDRFSLETHEHGVFATVLPVLAVTAMLASGWVVEFSAVSLEVVRQHSVAMQALLFQAALGAAVFCAALAAFVGIGTQLLFELPVRWIQGAVRPRVVLALEALRPLSVVIFVSLAFNLLGGLLVHELWPTAIVAGLRVP